MVDDELRRVYFSPENPGSYSGAEKLFRSQKGATRRQVKNFLKEQEAYTLHAPVRYKIKRPKVVTSTIDTQWDADLGSMLQYKEENGGYGYFLLTVDILSHYIHTRPLKTKKPEEVAKAMLDIFAQSRKPEYLRTDGGGEFTAFSFQKAMKKAGVHHFVARNEVSMDTVG